MPMFEYQCDCGKITEKFMFKKQLSIKCSCGNYAQYRISAPYIDYLHMGVDPNGSPTAADKWAVMHEKKAQYR